ncbi:proline-rich protein 36-like [Felis catus]|uniref:proline-rich protein 36-like n=1 Tax=Felis catus TaxID=9685 RepID=UPI001D19D3BE|nr:proline-rich protein 36-like [Felis catus]XP_044889435.1 proline-rich protein 36-like [Felis catus]
MGPRPGARRVSPSLDLGLREGRAAESGPGPGPRATLAGGGAGGACRRRQSEDESGGWGAEAGLPGQRNRARGWEPKRAGLRPALSGVRRLKVQSPARLSSLGDSGLTKPRGEWGEERRRARGLLFLGGPLPRLCPSQPPERCSDSRLHKDRGATVTPKSGTTRPPSHPCRDIERRVQFSAGFGALVSLPGSQGTRVSTLCTVRASDNPLSRSPIQGTRLREARWEEEPRRCAQQCTDGARPRSPPPSKHPNSADPLHQPGTQRAGTLPVPSRTSERCPQLRRPPSSWPPLQPHLPKLRGTCSEIRVSGTEIAAGGQQPRTTPSSQSVIGALARCDERPNGMEPGSELPAAVGSGKPRVPVAAPTPAAAPRRKTMRPPGALGRAPAAPPASRPAPPPARLWASATNLALGSWLDTAFSTPLHQ